MEAIVKNDRKYTRVHIKDGKIDTSEEREGRSRADAFYKRGNTLLQKAKELHMTTGAHVKVLAIPKWSGGKVKEYQSEGFPCAEVIEIGAEVTIGDVDIGNHSENAGQSSPLKTISEKENIPSVGQKVTKSKNKCSICKIEYGSESDFESYWLQCTKSCGYLVHARCCGIIYPTDPAGLRAMTKWANGKFFCPKHIVS